jgi:transposase
VSIIGGLDVHRRQVTFDWVDRGSGEAHRGRIAPATRASLRAWLGSLPSAGGAFAVEGCTGWRFVAEELQAAGLVAHLAEPAETSSLRGPKRRAKTDRADARLLRELLEQGRLPCSWIPPAWMLDLRTTVRLRKTLVDQRTAFKQRIHAALFHHGLPRPTQELLSQATRAWLERVALPPASRQLLAVALGQINGLDAELAPDRPVAAGPGPLPAGLPGADRHPLRDRGDHRSDHPGRAGRCPPLRRRRPGGAGHRAGRHRVRL